MGVVIAAVIVIGLCCLLAGGVIVQAINRRHEKDEIIDLRERLDPHVRGLEARANAVTAIRNRRGQPPE